MRHSEKHWSSMYSIDRTLANAELFTASETAAMTTQLGIAACNAILTQEGTGSSSCEFESFLSDFEPSEIVEVACGLFQGGHICSPSEEQAARTASTVARLARHVSKAAVSQPGWMVRPSDRIGAASMLMGALARTQVCSLQASATMQLLDDILVEGL